MLFYVTFYNMAGNETVRMIVAAESEDQAKERAALEVNMYWRLERCVRIDNVEYLLEL